VQDDRPALRQQLVVHRCRECRQEWRKTSKGRVPAQTPKNEPTEVVEVDDPEDIDDLEDEHEKRGLDKTSHVGRRGEPTRSPYIPRSVVQKVRWPASIGSLDRGRSLRTAIP
jgi:hypothetical protein